MTREQNKSSPRSHRRTRSARKRGVPAGGPDESESWGRAAGLIEDIALESRFGFFRQVSTANGNTLHALIFRRC